LWRELLRAGELERLAEFVFLIGIGAPALDEIRQDDLDVALKATAATIPPGTPEHLDLIERIDVRNDLPKIKVPTLVISTTHDSVCDSLSFPE
jgi:pimeloyl-ACP methyl ester carboxylesterase